MTGERVRFGRHVPGERIVNPGVQLRKQQEDNAMETTTQKRDYLAKQLGRMDRFIKSADETTPEGERAAKSAREAHRALAAEYLALRNPSAAAMQGATPERDDLRKQEVDLANAMGEMERVMKSDTATPVEKQAARSAHRRLQVEYADHVHPGVGAYYDELERDGLWAA